MSIEAMRNAVEAMDKHDFEMADHILCQAIAEAEKQEQGEPVAKLFGTLPVYDTTPQQPKQEQGEPVAIYQYQMGDGSWIDQEKHSYDYNKLHAPNAILRVVYTTPQQRTWVGLTDIEINDLVHSHDDFDGLWEFADAVESKLKEKNA